ncbi:MAG TPA: DUF368 domain-containing protein [Desulfosarcina sp.]|nr:DUF368 domain-containing protein [Desulfosarcina sp.]
MAQLTDPAPPPRKGAPPASAPVHWSQDVGCVVRGLCMGAADVVPGVSGGTVALILGIYHRLVTAISHFDMQLVAELRRGRWKQAARHVDLRFLLLLATGIAGGFLLMTLVVNGLLNNSVTRPFLLAAFFGMILGSAVLVARLIHYRSLAEFMQALLLGVAGGAFAFWLTTLTMSARDPSLLYLFACGLVATCAMILPGISGAMILLILGVYGHLTDIPHQLLRGENVVQGLTTIAVFGAGCAISLISISKVLRWLLVRHQTQTMGLLCGLMFGALGKLWPFQVDRTPELPFKEKTLEPVWPSAWDVSTFSILAVIAVSMVLVLSADWWIRRSHRERALADQDDSAPERSA